MTHRQDTVSSLILAPIRSGLRGFCLFILEIFSMEYQQKNPLKYYALPFLSKFVNKVQFRLVGFAKAKGYRKINFFTTSALCKCIFWGYIFSSFFTRSQIFFFNTGWIISGAISHRGLRTKSLSCIKG